MNFIRNHKSIFLISGIVTLIICALLIFFAYIYSNYKVTTIFVEGNEHYTNEEVINMVMGDTFGGNSLFLSWKYKNKSIENIPFVSKMDVDIIDPNTIKIVVYEKALAGYIEYLEKYMYFDKDGMVVEASSQKTKGIPLVTGLSFDHVVLYDFLPVEDSSIFASILSITQLVNKYNLQIDRIYFGNDDTVTLYFDEIRVALGQPVNLDEKIMRLQYMLPEIDGMKGVLRMENYTDETKSISFEPDEIVDKNDTDIVNEDDI